MRTAPAVARLAKVVAVLAFVVVSAGMAVVSTRSGLADEGWPLFSGNVLPSLQEMSQDRGKFYEHGHRAIAATLGLLTVSLAVVLSLNEPRKWVRRLGLAAAVLVIVLGSLGGATVLLKLPAAVSILHVSVAMLFLGITTTLAVVTGAGWATAQVEIASTKGLSLEDARWLRAGAIVTLILVYAQIVLGAVPRHLHSGAIPHIVGAFVVFTAVVMVSTRVLGRHSHLTRLLGPSMIGLALMMAQFFLGFTSFVVRPEVAKAPGTRLYELVSAGHAAVGALLLIVSVLVALRAGRYATLMACSVDSPGEGAPA